LNYYHGPNVPAEFFTIVRASTSEIEFRIRIEWTDKKMYEERTYRNLVKTEDLVKFEVIVKETDLRKKGLSHHRRRRTDGAVFPLRNPSSGHPGHASAEAHCTGEGENNPCLFLSRSL
jgi:hypothetical protein